MYNYKEESVRRMRERIERSGVPSDNVVRVTRYQTYNLSENTMTTKYGIETADGEWYLGPSLEEAIANYFRELAKIVFGKSPNTPQEEE